MFQIKFYAKYCREDGAASDEPAVVGAGNGIKHRAAPAGRTARHFRGSHRPLQLVKKESAFAFSPSSILRRDGLDRTPPAHFWFLLVGNGGVVCNSRAAWESKCQDAVGNVGHEARSAIIYCLSIRRNVKRVRHLQQYDPLHDEIVLVIPETLPEWIQEVSCSLEIVSRLKSAPRKSRSPPCFEIRAHQLPTASATEFVHHSPHHLPNFCASLAPVFSLFPCCQQLQIN
jgi:hypothetical protein